MAAQDAPGGGAYTHGHHDSVLRSHRWRTVANSAAYLRPHLRPGYRVLDVGCGPGTLTVDLARCVAPGHVLGIDTSGDVVAEATAHVAGVVADDPEAADVEVRMADLGELQVGRSPVPDGGFDVVHAHQVLQHVADPVGALRAMAALARTGGLVAARDADYETCAWAPPDERLDRWLDTVNRVMGRNGGSSVAGRSMPRWVRDAGLADVTFTTSTWTFVTPEERAWWADLWAERTVASRMARQARDDGIATSAELEEMAQGWRDWADHPDALFVMVHGELLART